MTTQMIAWNTLVPSPRNVRRIKSDVAGPAASIAADGLLQNLVVARREDGKFEVLAGERRRRAIGQLVKAKAWRKDELVACEVRAQGGATALSLAENAMRVAMHPADAFRAFAALAAEGHDETAIPTDMATTRVKSAAFWRWAGLARRCWRRSRLTGSMWRRPKRSASPTTTLGRRPYCVRRALPTRSGAY